MGVRKFLPNRYSATIPTVGQEEKLVVATLVFIAESNDGISVISATRPLPRAKAPYSTDFAIDFVTQMITLLAYRCPIATIVAALGIDERTVANWRRRVGKHCQ